ncbi:hypothetical protein SEUCBS139899_007769 [Sporothrix eucalyptigena]|uniref:DUF1996 domain-containing protein n=1 Tax=Sporothrix eucalyptigena TaxID=1812306 RepID=A0ABP0B3B3_9PEZI
MHIKFLLVARLAQHALAQGMPMLRFQCNQLVVDRLDPLVNPGAVPSPHLHQVVGGNSFNASMDPSTHDLVTGSTCTTCTFSEDFSNYWTAVLYFKARNGSYTRVPQMPSQGLKGNGGVTVYYIPSSNTKNKVTAFKPGFRMLVGDAGLQAATPNPAHKVCHRCMPASGDNSNLNCASPDGPTLPKGFCAGGIRSVITFPTCWDGKNTDSADHKSHVSYPQGTGVNDVGSNGNCPSTHPVRIPQVMLETMWDTRSFNKKELWPADGSQPFIWSTGDSYGYSQHGDYVFGWKGDSLQKAMDARCSGATCSALKTQSDDAATKCHVKAEVREAVDGWLEHLPGDMDETTAA